MDHSGSRQGQGAGVSKAEYRQSLATSAGSCADLIRASIPLHEMHFTKMMNCRVKPGNDNKQANTAET
jgi:hypothetical protein